MRKKRNNRVRRVAGGAVACVAALSAGSAGWAQTYIWDGGASFGNWSNAVNWQANTLPGQGIDTSLIFTKSAAGSRNIDCDYSSFTLNFLSLQDNYRLSGGRLQFSRTLANTLPQIDFAGTNGAISNELALFSDLRIGGSGSSTSTLHLSGSINQNGGIIKSGAFTLVLDSPNNTYAGTTRIEQGSITLNAGGALSSNSDIVLAGGILDCGGHAITIKNLTFDGPYTNLDTAFSGYGKVTLLGDITLNIAAANTTSGLVILDEIVLGAGNHTLTNTGYTTSSLYNYDFHGTLSGSGGLTITQGSGPNPANYVRLGEVSTYTGPTTVAAGILFLGVENALSAGNAVTVDGGLDFVQYSTPQREGYDQAFGSLAGTGHVWMGSAHITVGSNNSSTAFTGQLDGTSAGSVTKVGTGTWTLGGTATYGGGTTIAGGTLRLGSDDALLNGSAITLLGGATLDMNGKRLDLSDLVLGDGVTSGAMRVTGGGAITYRGNLTANFTAGGATPPITVSARLDLTAGQHVLDYNGVSSSGAYDLVLSGGITNASTASGLTKRGGGFGVAITAPTSYTGETRVEEGRLYLGATNALSAQSAVTVSNGAGLYLNPAVTQAGVTAGSYNQTFGSLAGAGVVSLGGATLTTGGNNASTTFSGTMSGTGGSLTKTGTGTLSLNGALTYTGATNVQNGTLLLGSGTTLANSANVDVSGSNTHLNLQNLASHTLQGLTGTGGGTIDGLGTALTVGGNNAASATFNGTLWASGITKTGSGAWTLAGIANTPTITVNGGTLTLQGIIGNTNLYVNGATAQLNYDSPVSMGGITVTGGGTLRLLKNDTIGLGASVNIAAGTFDTNGFSATLNHLSLGDGVSTAPIAVTGGGTLTLFGDITYKGAPNHLTPAAIIDTNLFLYGDHHQITNNGNFSSGSYDVVFNGEISGNTTLTKEGSSDFFVALNHTNSFTGGVRVASGYLYTGAENALGIDPTVTVDSGAALLMNPGTTANGVTAGNYRQVIGGLYGGGFVGIGNTRLTLGSGNQSGTFDGTIDGSSSATLVKIGSGTQALNGTSNTYGGGTAVQGGVLQIAGDGSLGAAGSGLLLDGGGIRYGASFDLGNARLITLGSNGGTFDTNGFSSTIQQSISGAGSLTKVGAGTLALGTTNSYTGGTNVNGGTLLVASDDRLGASSSAITWNGGTLQAGSSFITGSARNLVFTGSAIVGGIVTGGRGTVDTNGFDLTLGHTVSGAGKMFKVGAGKLTFAQGANTLGGFTAQGGTTLIGAGTTLTDTDSLANTATVLVDGSGAAWNAATISFTGAAARLDIRNGGHVRSTTDFVQNAGTSASDTLTTVSGAGSRLDVGRNLNLRSLGALHVTDGGAVAVGGILFIGGAGAQTTVDNGGTLNLASVSTTAGSDWTLKISDPGNGVSAVTFAPSSGGGIEDLVAQIQDAGSGPGSITVKAGANPSLIGTLHLVGTNNTYSGGTFIKEGAAVMIDGDGSLGAASGGVSLDNGSLKFQGAATLNSARTITLGSGGGVLYSDNFGGGDVTINGNIVGSGDLLIEGGKQIRFNGNTTYTGATTLRFGGNLIVNSDLSSSSGVTVENFGILGGKGRVSDIALQYGAVLTPGDGGIGTLAADSLLWQSGGTLKYDLGTGGLSDLLQLSGSLNKTTLYDWAGYTFDFGNTLARGTESFTLATFFGTDFNVADFSYTSLGPGMQGYFQLSQNALQFRTVIVPEASTGLLALPAGLLLLVGLITQKRRSVREVAVHQISDACGGEGRDGV